MGPATNFADLLVFGCCSDLILSSDRVLLQMPCLPCNRAAGSWSPATSAAWVSFQSLGPWNKSVVLPDVNLFPWASLQLDPFPDSLTLSLQKCWCWSKGAGSEQSVRLNRKCGTTPLKQSSRFTLGYNDHVKQSFVCWGVGGRTCPVPLWELGDSQTPLAFSPQHAWDALFSWPWVMWWGSE